MMQRVFDSRNGLVPALQICINFTQKPPRLDRDIAVRDCTGLGHGAREISADARETMACSCAAARPDWFRGGNLIHDATFHDSSRHAARAQLLAKRLLHADAI
jgi:hypothetical protein